MMSHINLLVNIDFCLILFIAALSALFIIINYMKGSKKG